MQLQCYSKDYYVGDVRYSLYMRPRIQFRKQNVHVLWTLRAGPIRLVSGGRLWTLEGDSYHPQRMA